MKKLLRIILVCIMGIGLIGCGSKTALSITKENYKEYGYNYADVELGKLIDNNKKGDKTYKPGDLADALAFLVSVEYGVDLEEMTKDKLEKGN